MFDPFANMTGGFSASASSSATAGPATSGGGSVSVGGLNPPAYLGTGGAAVPLWAWAALAAGLVLLLKRRKR